MNLFDRFWMWGNQNSYEYLDFLKESPPMSSDISFSSFFSFMNLCMTQQFLENPSYLINFNSNNRDVLHGKLFLPHPGSSHFETQIFGPPGGLKLYVLPTTRPFWVINFVLNLGRDFVLTITVYTRKSNEKESRILLESPMNKENINVSWIMTLLFSIFILESSYFLINSRLFFSFDFMVQFYLL